MSQVLYLRVVRFYMVIEILSFVKLLGCDTATERPAVAREKVSEMSEGVGDGYAQPRVRDLSLLGDTTSGEKRRTPEGMVRIPAGDFWMGCNPKVDDNCDDDEKPGRRVWLSEYFIDRTEVTVEQYARCVRADRCDAPVVPKVIVHCNWGNPSKDNHPINCVDWDQAKTFCEWTGGRVPTEEEWVAEATNGGKRKYPWGGQKPTCRYTLINKGGKLCGWYSKTWPVCLKPAGNSVSGLCDMCGNIWEWLSLPGDDARDWSAIRGGTWSRGWNTYDIPIEGGGWGTGIRSSKPLLYEGVLRLRRRADLALRDWFIGFRCGRESPVRRDNKITRTKKDSHRLKEAPAGIEWLYSKPAGIEFTKSVVTVAQYRACVEAGKCTKPKTDLTWMRRRSMDYNWGKPDRKNHPVNGVSWDDARNYCAWAGKRLPTEAEWEKAARGTDGRMYPWGNQDASCERAVMYGCGKERTRPVCSKKPGNSPYGLCDMAGNVYEWVADWYEEEYYESATSRNPGEPTGGKYRVVRGGSWNYPDVCASCRGRQKPSFKRYDAGFRCARGAAR